MKQHVCIQDIVLFVYGCVLCRGLLKDGVASAANVVYRQHYTGCIDNGMASWVLVDAAGNSSTVFETRNSQLQEVWR